MSFTRMFQPLVTPGYFFGEAIQQHAAKKVITSAQLLALNATPQVLVAAPGAGLALVLNLISIVKPAGTAYAGIGVGEELSVRYTNGSGTELAQVASAGFLDQTTAQVRVGYPYRAASGVSGVTPTANAALVLHLLVGEITTGNAPLHCWVLYTVVPTVV